MEQATKRTEPKKGPCAICKRQGIEPPADGDLVAGRKRDEATCGVVVWRGRVCEMHLEDFLTYRFL